MEHPKLAAWWQLPFWIVTELYLYIGAVGAVTMLMVIALWTLAAILNRASGSRWPYRVGARMTSLLAGAFLLGAPANLLFIAWLRYHAYIPGDPVVDWVPYVPTGSWIIEPTLGGRFINGGTPELLQRAWVVFAIPVWGLAWLLRDRLLQLFESQLPDYPITRLPDSEGRYLRM